MPPTDRHPTLLRLAAPTLTRLSDGLWHSVWPTADVERGLILHLARLAFGAGIAAAMGWAEVDGAWARITAAGRAAIAEGDGNA